MADTFSVMSTGTHCRPCRSGHYHSLSRLLGVNNLKHQGLKSISTNICLQSSGTGIFACRFWTAYPPYSFGRVCKLDQGQSVAALAIRFVESCSKVAAIRESDKTAPMYLTPGLCTLKPGDLVLIYFERWSF